ncbi:MAG: YraN family protein [Pseudomonadota bacterium]
MGSAATGNVGARAEQFACNYLQSRGLQLIARNFRRRGGEIDLIMLDRNVLVFVEVRYRASSRFTDPGLTVDIHKQRKLIRTAALFLTRHSQYADATIRFDVVAVLDAHHPDCHWIRDAFRPHDSAL